MKNSVLFFLAVILVVNAGTDDARQGCCSHHGGVCGCACCDGTPLSAKCAPYYDCGETEPEYSVTNENGPAQQAHSEAGEEPDDTVYFNTKSLKYHCPSCEWAARCTRNCIYVTRKKAMESGGIPCKVCGGTCR